MTPYTQEVEEALKWAKPLIENPQPPHMMTEAGKHGVVLAKEVLSSLSTIRAQEEEIAGLKKLVPINHGCKKNGCLLCHPLRDDKI